MRLRIRELLAERGMTAYALAKASGGRIPMQSAYRLVQEDGRLPTFKASMLDALCDVLEVGPSELFDAERPRRERDARRRR
jgi:DNA-binding Xre family transcriptional regulator